MFQNIAIQLTCSYDSTTHPERGKQTDHKTPTIFCLKLGVVWEYNRQTATNTEHHKDIVKNQEANIVNVNNLNYYYNCVAVVSTDYMGSKPTQKQLEWLQVQVTRKKFNLAHIFQNDLFKLNHINNILRHIQQRNKYGTLKKIQFMSKH